MTSRKLYPLFAIILFSIALMSCGNLGTAVVIWPPEDSVWKPGDLVTVKDESFLRDTYIVNLPDQRRLKTEIDQWRLRLFKRTKDAEAWAKNLGEWTDVYAICQYQGLPMRSEPSNTASRVYRFRDGDEVKVLGRNPGPVQVGNLQGYWYHVIADGGVNGYVFDYHLQVIRRNSDGEVVLNQRTVTDETLDNLLAAPWRPKNFSEMVVGRRVDLNLFRSDYGIFFDMESKTLSLRLPEKTVVETWTDIIRTKTSPPRYDFLGTSFRFTVNADNFVSVQYNDEQSEKFEAFIRLDEDMDEVIESEQNRRATLLEQLSEEGPTYGSRAYGELTIQEDGRFLWTGKSALISRGLISAKAGNDGRILFDTFADRSIASRHDGAFGLRFSNGEEARFLYAFENNGLRLLYVPSTATREGGVVTSDQFIDPVRLFFAPLPKEDTEENGTELPERLD
ncbi:MAG: SH3 domain-containing protein [Spirochaetales bacterium]|nr:SH3 domain-containing protein [Spirochaetales bacterium]